jgi:ankyrin repeat protein
MDDGRSGGGPRAAADRVESQSEEGTRFLREAVERNYEDSVAALLEAGADPNADRSPIIHMAQRASIVRLLLRAGARVDAGTGGWTALMSAAGSPNIYPAEVIRALIAAGAK